MSKEKETIKTLRKELQTLGCAIPRRPSLEPVRGNAAERYFIEAENEESLMEYMYTLASLIDENAPSGTTFGEDGSGNWVYS